MLVAFTMQVFMDHIRNPSVMQDLANYLKEHQQYTKRTVDVLLTLGKQIGPEFFQSGVSWPVVQSCFELAVASFPRSGDLTDLWDRILYNDIICLHSLPKLAPR
jgi:hypothetical protein